MTSLVPPHGGLTEPVCRTVPADADRRFSRPRQDPAASARLRRRSLDRLSPGRRRPEPAWSGPMDSATYNRVLDESVIEHNGKLYAWTIPLALPVTEELAKQLRPGQQVALVNTAGEIVAVLDITDVYPWDKKKYLQSRLSDRADRSSRRRHGADGRRRQDASAGRHDPGAAAAEGSAVRQVRAHAARGPQAAGREGLAARRRLPNPQSAAPRPRIRPGLRPGNAAAGRPQRRRLPESADRRDQGRRRRRRRPHAHLRGADPEPLAGRRRQRSGPLGPARRVGARSRDPARARHQDVLRRAERSGDARHLPPELRLHRHHHRPQARRRPVPRRHADLGRFRRPGDLQQPRRRSEDPARCWSASPPSTSRSAGSI